MFMSPQGLAFGPDGHLYVCDMLNARIQIFSAEGTYVGQFGERGDQASQFENPKDLAFDSEGNLHIIDGRRSSLYTYTPEGRLLLVTGMGRASSSPFGFSVPKAIDIDVNDRIYITESLGHRFTIWQYMSKKYLAKNPYTEGDKEALLDYMEKVKTEAQ
jgi:sugar lactone lactonase YvrE